MAIWNIFAHTITGKLWQEFNKVILVFLGNIIKIVTLYILCLIILFSRQKYFRNELYCFFARKDKKSTIIQYTSLSKNYITYFISSLVLYCYIYIADQTNNVVVSAIFIVPGKISQIRFFSLIFSAKHPNRKVKWCEKMWESSFQPKRGRYCVLPFV